MRIGKGPVFGFKNNLRTKVTLFFSAMVLLFAIINGVSTSRIVSSILTRELLDDSVLLTVSFSKHLTEPFLARDTGKLTDLLFEQKYSHKPLAYLFVLDQEGRCLASTSLDSSLDKEIKIPNPLLPGQDHSSLLAQTPLGPVYDIAVPLAYGRGVLRIGFFRKDIDLVVRWTLIVLLLTALAVFVGAVLFAHFLAGALVKPLLYFKSSLQRIGQGDLDAKVEINTHDELGDLARAFNQMVQDLKTSKEDLSKTTVSRDSLIREIAVRKKAEENLALLSQKNELILNSAAEGILGLDLKGNHTFANPSAARMLGYEINELLGRPGHSLWHHTKSDGTPFPTEGCKIHSAFHGGETHRVSDEVFWRKDGTSFPVEYTSTPIHQHGRLSGVVVVFSDSTERKKAEEALRESQQLLEVIMNAISVRVFWKDKNLVYLGCNAVFAQDAGFTDPKDVIGKDDYQMVWREQAELYRGDDRQVIESGHSKLLIEEPQVTPKGNTITLLTSKIPLRTSAGEIIGVLGTYFDITERKLFAEAENAKIAAEMANKAKSQFLAAMSHEIRTPLSAVIGFTDILSNTPLNDEQKKYIDTMGLSGKLLLNLVNDILDFSKIEAGKITLEEIDFNLEYLVKDVFRIITSKIQGTKIVAYVDFDKDTPTHVNGDPTRMRQILLNLLNNAVKFTDEGEVGLIVRPSDETAPLDTAAILMTVKDTGIGISKDKLDLLFKPFSQVDMSTTRKYGGTGLGLSICKPLIEKMGGRIWAESDGHAGSEFKFTVKLKKSAAPVEDKVIFLTKEQLAEKKILIVDDNRTSQEILKRYCRDIGLSIVFIASSAKEAIDHIRGLAETGSYPDMVLSDIRMAGMDGYELAEKLNALFPSSGMKYIAVTSDIWPGASRESEMRGFHGYVTKPVFRDDLTGVIETIFGDRRPEKKIITKHTSNEFACKGMRVLVAEDAQTNRELVEIFLTGWGCLVDFAENGKEALEKLRVNKYDLCLMDLQMPEMGGLEAVQIIRREISKDFPVIALTAAVTDDVRTVCMNNGMTDYIVKPIDVDELREKLIRYGRPNG